MYFSGKNTYFSVPAHSLRLLLLLLLLPLSLPGLDPVSVPNRKEEVNIFFIFNRKYYFG
jgi:hypothetical protein